MGMGHPTVEVWCDEKNCQCSETIELTSIARNGFDLRGLNRKMERMGWKIDGSCFTCDCHGEEE